MSCERCERDIERLRGELNILRSEMIEVVGGMLAHVDEVLATVETSHRQMFASSADRRRLCAPAGVHRGTVPNLPQGRRATEIELKAGQALASACVVRQARGLKIFDGSAISMCFCTAPRWNRSRQRAVSAARRCRQAEVFSTISQPL